MVSTTNGKLGLYLILNTNVWPSSKTRSVEGDLGSAKFDLLHGISCCYSTDAEKNSHYHITK